MGHGVSYPNYRQRLEVKAFAFVSGDKALPGLVSAAYCLHYSAGPPCFLQVNGHICFVSRYTSTAVSSSAAASSWTPLCAQRGAPGCLEGSEVMPRQALCPVAVPMVQHHAAHVSLLCAVAGSGMLGASSVVSLQGPVLLVPHGWAAARGEERCWCALAGGGGGQPLTLVLFCSLCRGHFAEQGGVGCSDCNCCWCFLSDGHNAAIYGSS